MVNLNFTDIRMVQEIRGSGKLKTLERLMKSNHCDATKASELYQHIEVYLRSLGLW